MIDLDFNVGCVIRTMVRTAHPTQIFCFGKIEHE